jgi:hypothetical protein
MLARPTVAGNWKDQRNIMRIDLLMLGDADGPDEITSTQALPERSRQTIPSIGEHDAKANTRRYHTISSNAISGLVLG